MKVKDEIKEAKQVIEESSPATLEEIAEIAKDKNKGMQEDKEL